MSTANARIKFKRDSTQNWNDARGMIPLEGEVIVYNDYATVTKIVDNEEKTIIIPAIKIGDGKAYVQDLPFVNDDLRDQLLNHINNPEIHVTMADHVTMAEKLFWNNKINVNDASEVVNGALIFNRN